MGNTVTWFVYVKTPEKLFDYTGTTSPSLLIDHTYNVLATSFGGTQGSRRGLARSSKNRFFSYNVQVKGNIVSFAEVSSGYILVRTPRLCMEEPTSLKMEKGTKA